MFYKSTTRIIIYKLIFQQSNHNMHFHFLLDMLSVHAVDSTFACRVPTRCI